MKYICLMVSILCCALAMTSSQISGDAVLITTVLNLLYLGWISHE